jgi:tetratricopeptide (TPR) repeat protein
MVPVIVPLTGLDASRSLRVAHQAMAEQERALYPDGGDAERTLDAEDTRRRSALTSWSGQELSASTRVGEVPDPGVLLGVLSEGPIAAAPLPIDIAAQTLRRFTVRSPELKARFDEHVDRAGTYMPAWLPPDERRQKSQEAFDAAMKVAREQGFATAAAIFEGIRGESYPEAQIAVAVYELRELRETASALRRLGDVLRVAPGNVAARMLRAKALMEDPGRLVEAASDLLVVLRELSEADREPAPASALATNRPAREIRDQAIEGLWALHRSFAAPAELDEALALVQRDPARGFEALWKYVHAHPCAWDAQAHLGTLALAARRFEVTTRMLGNIRWLFPEDPNPHFVYGQALASQGRAKLAVQALELAAALSPDDADIAAWVSYAREQAILQAREGEPPAPIIPGVPAIRGAKSPHVSHPMARSLLILVGLVKGGRVVPAAFLTPKLPGGFPFAFALHELGEVERRLNAGPGAPPARGPAPRVADRCVLTDYQGNAVRTEGPIGEVPDPGVVVAILYAEPGRDAAGRPLFDPPPAQCRAALIRAVQGDSEVSSRLERHLASDEASVKSRLGGS